ncbi:Peptide methionine sulfoxide reductase B5 [Triticum urartu]|uniref:Peptide methionine sulfoxide reductase B5 n=1 Tax=Triticum urartu TaxID=4572 RepID=M7YDW5_TRIUA|nr:Peptide methionine sulfoxide reductase B5 [Triticum urartu]
MASGDSKPRSEEEWRAVLNPEQFRILRLKGTELPGTGEYNKFYGDGAYNCVGCGTPLYKSTTKFDSGCGWPAFFEGLPGAIHRTAKNMRPALLLFYALALLEASLFLLEKAYWTWKMSVCKLLDQVSADCELGPYGLVSLKRFFYDAYSQCVAGSIFDGIKMDLVTFAEDLILSDFLDEQLIGARILQQLATSKGSARDTLRKLGTNPRSIERAVEMLNWKRHDEEEVRRCAAQVVSKLAGKRQNALRVSGIPGAIESVMSLLYTGRGPPTTSLDHPQGAAAAEQPDRIYDYLQFNLLGLHILKKLARDHDNCGKIGNARGLLAKIVEFTHVSPALLLNPSASDSQVRSVKRALQVIKMLVYTTGATGKALRRDVAENVFTVSNLRGVLQHGHQRMELQKLAMDVLTGMAMDERAKETIVGTGGVVNLLLSIFFNAGECELGNEAGEALAMLALESEASCSAILKRADVLDQRACALDARDARCLNAMRVLRNLCAYAGAEHRTRLSTVTKAMPTVLGATMTGRDKILEVSVGLTTQICRFLDVDQFTAELRGAGLDERAYVERLVGILRQYRQLLEAIAETTSEVECYHVFSGSVPIGKHRESFSAIVDTALQLLAAGEDAAGAGGGESVG